MLREFYIKMFKKCQTIEFWCDMVVYFCIFSIVGHLMEIPYCMLNDYLWDIVPEDSGVWGYPFEPFIVYGTAVVFLIIFVYPAYQWLGTKVKNVVAKVSIAFVVCVLVSMLFELVMGLIFNQPVDGVYPLWDNSYLPGNILKQAWIVNDVLLGAVAVIFIAFIYPLMQKQFDKNSRKVKIIGASIVLLLFLINMHVTYGVFHE